MNSAVHRRPAFYRRKYLVKKGLQLKYTFLIVGMMVVMSVMVGGGIFYSVWGSVKDEFDVGRIVSSLETTKQTAGQQLLIQAQQENWSGERIQEEEKRQQAKILAENRLKWLSNTLHVTLTKLGIISIVLLIVVIVGGIFLSHKIAGPIYRFEQILRSIVEGDLSIPVRLRKHDELQEVAAEFSEVIESLRGFVFRQREMMKKAAEVASRLEGSPAPAVEVAELKKIVSGMNTELSKYRTSANEKKS